MNDQPGFSVVIPTYNYGHCIERALRSTLDQDYPCFEVRVINDGSTDNTAEVVQTLKNQGLEFDYVEQKNAGLSAVRNRGVAESRYEWLIFLDADDEMLDSALARFAATISEKPSAKMIVAAHESVFADGRRKMVRPHEMSQRRTVNLERYLTKQFSIANGACAMHKSVFHDIAYREDMRQTEDIPVFSHVLAHFDLAVLPEPVARIYKHPGSLRHDIAAARAVGMELEEIIFEKSGLPREAQFLRKQYHGRRALSLLKMCYRSGDYHGVIKFYGEAIRSLPLKALSPRILRRFLMSVIKR